MSKTWNSNYQIIVVSRFSRDQCTYGRVSYLRKRKLDPATPTDRRPVKVGLGRE